MIYQLQSVLGLIAFPLLAWLLCRSERMDGWQAFKLVVVGVGLQFLIGAAFLLLPQLKIFFEIVAAGVGALQAATNEGMKFVFGHLAGGDTPYEVKKPHSAFILATQALPLILLVSVLSKLLYHFGILQRIVGFFAWILQKTMGVSGPLGTAASANIFVGMVEAPLLVRPYIATMSRGALFATMTVGMATVAGTVMALYASILESNLPGAAGHVLVASVMSAPAAIVIARLMVPWQKGEHEEAIEANDNIPKGSVMSAIAEGTTDGLKLLTNVIGLLVVMVALVALINMLLGQIPVPTEFGKLTIERIFGFLAAPLALLMGIPWSEAMSAGELIGIKSVLNEFLAYLKLAGMGEELSDRSRTMLTYALCGFANPGSLGIMIGGLLAMAPERKDDILKLAPWSLLAGTLATLMTGAVVGVMLAG